MADRMTINELPDLARKPVKIDHVLDAAAELAKIPVDDLALADHLALAMIYGQMRRMAERHRTAR